MFKRLLLVLAMVGCASADEGFDSELEVGQLEQAITGATNPSFQYGTQTGSDRNRCNKTSSGQVCMVPSKRVNSVCIHTANFLSPPSPPPTFTASESATIRAFITNVYEPRGTWQFNIDDTLGDGTFLADCFARSTPADISITIGAVGSSGSGSNNVKDYSSTTFNGAVSLTEGAGVVGSYQRWTTCNIKVDRVDAYAKGTSSTQDQNALGHAAAHGFAGCLGLGTASGIQSDRAARSLFQPSTVAVGVTSGEGCALDNFSSVLQSQYNNGTVCAND